MDSSCDDFCVQRWIAIFHHHHSTLGTYCKVNSNPVLNEVFKESSTLSGYNGWPLHATNHKWEIEIQSSTSPLVANVQHFYQCLFDDEALWGNMARRSITKDFWTGLIKVWFNNSVFRIRFAVWLVMGVFVYGLYGWHNASEEYVLRGKQPPAIAGPSN